MSGVAVAASSLLLNGRFFDAMGSFQWSYYLLLITLSSFAVAPFLNYGIYFFFIEET
jgi:hypothetical protein